MKITRWLIIIIITAASPGICSQSRSPASTEPIPYLKIAMDAAYPPLTFLNTDGQPVGMFVDIWRLWAKKTGCEIEFHVGNWQQSLDSIKIRTADVHCGLFYSEARAQWLAFSQPLFAAKSYFFCSVESEYHLQSDKIEAKKLGAIKGSYQESYLRKHFPFADVVAFFDREAMIRALISGEIDLFLAENVPITSAVTKLGLTGKIRTDHKAIFSEEFRAGVLKERNELIDLIEAGFEAISYDELVKIEQLWIPDSSERYYKLSPPQIRLTTKQKQWLKKHSETYLGLFEDIEPAMFRDGKGTFQGIVKEICDLIGKRAGVPFSIVPISPSMRKDLLTHVREGKIHVFPGFETPSRKKHLFFTEPIYTVTWVIVARHETPFISGLHDLHSLGMKLILIKNAKWGPIIKENYPDLDVTYTDTSSDALKKVSRGQADAIVIGLDVAGYLIQKHGLHNLKVACPAGYPDSVTRLAVSKDTPELVRILNKAIQSLRRNEIDTIIGKWLPVHYEKGIDPAHVRNIILMFIIVFTSLLLVSFFWNRRLAREIAERKHAESRLEKALAQLRAVFEAIPAHINVVDKNFNLLDANVDQNLLEQLGFRNKNEIIGKKCYAVFKQRDFPCDGCTIYSCMKSGRLEIRYSSAEEDRLLGYSTKLYAVPMKDTSGDIIGAVECAVDVTDLRNMEAQLKNYAESLEQMVEARAAELKKAQKSLLVKERLAVLGHFAGSISHELRNPLAVLESSAYFLKMKLGQSDEKIDQHLNYISSNVKKSTAIIESLLNLSRMEKPKTESTGLNDLVLETLRSSAIPDTVNVHSSLPQPPVFIDIDGEQIRIALKNMINNAVQAMDGQGALTVKVIVMDEQRTDIEINDTGSGIAPDHIEKIFEPLFTTKARGIGFGLSITKMIIENHGGTIHVNSIPGKGTTFTISLRNQGRSEDALVK